MGILVLGTTALDSLKTPLGTRDNILGGSAVHFAMAARHFTQVNLVAVVGQDFPKKHISFLKRKDVVVDSITTAEGPSFRWSGEYKGNLNAAITLKTELGVLLTFQPKITPVQKKIKYVFLANLDPDIQRNLLKQMHSPRLVGLDSMNFWIQNKRKSLLGMLKLVDIYTANEAEAQDLTGESNLNKAARALRKLGPKMVIIKKGEHGVSFYSDKFVFSLPGYPVEALVDPTGAGDTFAGGFMGYLASSKRLGEKDIKKAIAYGVAFSSFNVEKFGVERTARLTLSQVSKRLKEINKLVSF